MTKKLCVLAIILCLASAGLGAEGPIRIAGILYRTSGAVDAARAARALELYRGDEFPDEPSISAAVREAERMLGQSIPDYEPSVSYFLSEKSDGVSEAFIEVTLSSGTGIDQILPTEPRGHSVSSGRGDAPAAAGFITPVLGIRPLLAGPVRDVGDGPAFFLPAVFGGYDDGDIFGGFRLMVGSSYQDTEDLGFFVRINIHGEYERIAGMGEKIVAWSTTFGFFGKGEISWALASTLVCEDQNGYNPFGSAVLGTILDLADLGTLGILKGTGDLGVRYGVAGSAEEMPNLFLATTLSLDNRTYLGPLSEGLAARLSAEGGLDIADAAAYGTLSLILEGSLRFGTRAGLRIRGGFLLSSAGYAEWTDQLRALDTGSVSGDLGVLASVETPLLFARGVLLHSRDLGVDFFLTPYLDAALIRPNSSVSLFDAASLFACAGGRLGMTLDRHRRSVLEVSAGADISGLLAGDPGYAMDLRLAASLNVTF